jgi:hypothetical protein
MNGAVILDKAIDQSSGSLSLAALPAGLYLAQLEMTSGLIQSVKILRAQ